MLTKAKKMREEYLARVEDVANSIIDVINCLESEDGYWEMNSDDYEWDLLFLIDGSDEHEFGVDITEVYDYLSDLTDPSISPTKTVIEALEEIFEIDCTPWDFTLTLKGYVKASE